ncbi:MAG: ABC transporter ATP-binding protein [Faecalibacterium sp.]
MKKLMPFFRDYQKECILAPLFKMLEASFDLCVPLVMAAIIDVGIANNDTPYILRLAGVLVLLGLVGLTCSVTAQYFAAKAAVGFAVGLRRTLFAKIQSLSFAQMDTIGTSTLITRMTSDVNQVQNGVNLFLRLFLRNPVIIFGSMIFAFLLDVRAALIFVVAIPILAIIIYRVISWTTPLYKQVQLKLDGILGRTRENLTGVRVVRAFDKQNAEVAQFQAENAQLTTLQQKVGSVSTLMNPLTYCVANIAIIAILATGAGYFGSTSLLQGNVIALVNYMGLILVELGKVSNLSVQVSKGLASAGRVEKILALESDMQFPADAKTPHAASADAASPAVQFNHVCLNYHGAGDASLSEISFTAARGQVIGIIGGTGSGKSSLVNLIPRFYDVTSGNVCIFGEAITSYPKDALRGRIGIVPQRAQLFGGTIRSNLLWGNENATDAQLWAALTAAQGAEFVQSKADGLDTVINHGGQNLSGGQRQRLTIARALVQNPDILILDDSASALDYATDAALRKAIADLPGDKTVFIVSQRTSSIQNADQILVLDDGALIGTGSHNTLLETCAVYREIHESQFAKGGAQ